MSISSYVKKQREKYSVDLLGNNDYWYLSTSNVCYFEIIKKIKNFK